ISVAASSPAVRWGAGVRFGAGVASAGRGGWTTVWVTLAPQAEQVSPPSLTASQTAQRQRVLMGRRPPSSAPGACRPAAGLGQAPGAGAAPAGAHGAPASFPRPRRLPTGPRVGPGSGAGDGAREVAARSPLP